MIDECVAGDFIKTSDGTIHRVLNVMGNSLQTAPYKGKDGYGGVTYVHKTKATKTATPKDVKEEVMTDMTENTGVTDYNPPSQGGTRKELLAKYHKTKSPEDAEAARKAGASQKELQGVTEMDSQGYKGHRGDEDPGKGPEKTVQPAMAKDVTKSAEEVLTRAMNKAHKKQGVEEGNKENKQKKNDYVASIIQQKLHPSVLPSLKYGRRELQKQQGVEEGYEDRKNAPSWHSDSVKNPNFNDELSGRRVSAPGKRLKSGKLSADERWSQERTKTLMKYKQKHGGLTGPKGVLPEEQSVAEGYTFVKNKNAHYEKTGHAVVGTTEDDQKRKGANILRHREGGYFAAGGSSTGFRSGMKLHDTPEAAAKHYHGEQYNEEVQELNKDKGKSKELEFGTRIVADKVARKEGTKPAGSVTTEEATKENDPPFDPDPPKKAPSAKSGKYGLGYSVARHLARTGMKAAEKKTPVKEETTMSPMDKYLAAIDGKVDFAEAYKTKTMKEEEWCPKCHADPCKCDDVKVTDGTMMTKEDTEQVEEKYVGFKKLAKKVGSPALAAWIGREKYGKKKFQAAAAADHKMKNEEIEQIDEISNKTKQAYVNAAALDTTRLGNTLGRVQVKGSKEMQKVVGDKITNRLTGIRRATSKMAEDVDLTEEQIDEMINEVLGKDATAGDWIDDFVHSDNPKFEGKSKAERKKMALGAYYAKQNEEADKGTTPKTEKEKSLAALAEPKDKITHADVMKGRGVKKLGEGMISYSDFTDKINMHRKAGNKVIDDKYNDKHATYTSVSPEGDARKVTHTPTGTKHENLGNVSGAKDDEVEVKQPEKRGRGRPAGTKSGARH